MIGADQRLLDLAHGDFLCRNGVPAPEQVAGREQAAHLVETALAGTLRPVGLRVSVLGAGWTERFYAHVHHMPDPQALASLGWVDVEGLRGRPRRDRRLWAVSRGGPVLGAVEISASAPPDPVAGVLDRCVEHGEVRLLDVVELRALRRAGHPLPASSAVLAAAAEIETEVEQRELAQWATGAGRPAPVALRARRHRRVVVATSGVDGAGKSTLVHALETDLRQASLPVTRVWLRPGMGLGRLAAVAGTAKRVLRQDPTPGIRLVAADAAAGSGLRSRRGAVGWVWSSLVVTSFVAGLRRRHASARGVVLYDRHTLDAGATLEMAYQDVDTRLQRALVRLLVPTADASLYLRVPARVAVARKPGDVIGEAAVRRQLDVYDRELQRGGRVHVIDATRAPDDVAAEAFRRVAESVDAGPARRPAWLTLPRSRFTR